MAGCAPDIFDFNVNGNLTVAINETLSRTLIPSISMDPESYLVEGAGPGGASFSE